MKTFSQQDIVFQKIPQVNDRCATEDCSVFSPATRFLFFFFFFCIPRILMHTRTTVLLALVPTSIYCLISFSHTSLFYMFKKTFSAFYFSTFFVILLNSFADYFKMKRYTLLLLHFDAEMKGSCNLMLVQEAFLHRATKTWIHIYERRHTESRTKCVSTHKQTPVPQPAAPCAPL